MKPDTKNNRGQILLFLMVLTSVLLLYSLAIVNLAASARQVEKAEDLDAISENIADAAINKAIWCFNQTDGSNCGGSYGTNYAGETNVNFGGGIFDISITTIDALTKEAEATAYYPAKTNIIAKSIIRTQISVDSDKASFYYGTQIGEGGLSIDTGASIQGSVYALGTIEGQGSAQITGDAYVAGGTALTADQEHTVYNFDFIFGKVAGTIDLAQSFIPSSSNVLNKISLFIKKAGTPSDLIIKIVNDNSGLPGGTVYASATLSGSFVTTSYNWLDIAFGSPPNLNGSTKYWIILDANQNSSNYWTIGSDAFDGYANGTMYHCSDWTGGGWAANGYDVNFKIWMGGMVTGINNVHIGGNAYAHYLTNSTVNGNAEAFTINNSTIGGNAHADSIQLSAVNGHATTMSIADSHVIRDLWCQTRVNTTVDGTVYCPTSVTPPADPGQISMPVSDALINDWKNAAAAGGTIEGNYTVAIDQSLGPKKIHGNLIINGNKILTLTGSIYVTGTITFNNNSSAVLSSSYGLFSGMLIADGKIIINNNVTFSSAGTGSYLIVISTFAHPTETAILINNNANTSIFYVPYGIIEVSNNAIITEVIAYKLKLNNNVSLVYEIGLANLSFSSGPSGGWSESKGTWRVVE